MLSRIRLFATPWIEAHQASLSITNSWSSLRLMSIELVMPSSHFILCHPLLLLPPIPPSISLFQWVNFAWGGQSTGIPALASFLPKKSQGWSPSEWTGWFFLQSKGLSSKGLSRVFSNTTGDQTHVPCIGRQILNHWITREVLTELSISEHLQYSSSVKVTLTAHLKLRDQRRCCPWIAVAIMMWEMEN